MGAILPTPVVFIISAFWIYLFKDADPYDINTACMDIDITNKSIIKVLICGISLTFPVSPVLTFILYSAFFSAWEAALVDRIFIIEKNLEPVALQEVLSHWKLMLFIPLAVVVGTNDPAMDISHILVNFLRLYIAKNNNAVVA